MIPDTPAPAEQTYGRGFNGLIAGDTAISRIDGEAGVLIVRGYAIADLAAECSFEEVAWLILDGELPTAAELDRWRSELRQWRTPPAEALAVIERLPAGTLPFTAFRTGMAMASAVAPGAGITDIKAQWRRPARILSWSSALAAAAIRHYEGQPAVEPRNDLDFAAHFLWQALGELPSADGVRAFELSLLVQAEHDIHAAALAALTVASAGGDLDGAVLAGIGALSGRLHGGANQTAFEHVTNLESPDQAREWTKAKLAERYRFPGFGHRVYKTHDPRGRVLAPHAQRLLETSGRAQLWQCYDAMRDEIETALGSKGIYANIDAFTGLIYHPLGLPPAAFTIPFCLAIQTGWMAHCLEYLPDGAPFHPATV